MSAIALRTVEIVNKRGLHARASAKFVKLATEFDAEVRVSRDGQSVDARSIISPLTRIRHFTVPCMAGCDAPISITIRPEPSGTASIGSAFAPAPFTNSGGLPSFGFGSSLATSASNSLTPAPVRPDVKQIGTRWPSRRHCSNASCSSWPDRPDSPSSR